MGLGPDYKTGMPVRTDEDAHGKTQVRVVDSLDPTRQAEVTPNREVRTATTTPDMGVIMSLLANANFMKLSNFDRIVPTFASPLMTLSYYEGGAQVGEARVRYVTSTDWDMEMEAYVNDADGTILQDDDGSRLILE